MFWSVRSTRSGFLTCSGFYQESCRGTLPWKSAGRNLPGVFSRARLVGKHIFSYQKAGFCQVRPVRFSKIFNALTRNPVSGSLPWKSAGRNLPGVLSRARLAGKTYFQAKSGFSRILGAGPGGRFGEGPVRWILGAGPGGRSGRPAGPGSRSGGAVRGAGPAPKDGLARQNP